MTRNMQIVLELAEQSYERVTHMNQVALIPDPTSQEYVWKVDVRSLRTNWSEFISSEIA